MCIFLVMYQNRSFLGTKLGLNPGNVVIRYENTIFLLLGIYYNLFEKPVFGTYL